ncbi:unnamed protein product [Echinostoma caproni]|uniref:Uncharacterized protein n=1 Tax=Echinostoma caproni TaxID=27848 RepID=A0A183ACD2_9TREM|nr:unnamed protein product [Echinostoma caproni]
MMRCGIRMSTLVEILPPSQCNCQNPCEQVTYSIESITQALKAPLFAQSTGIFNSAVDVNDQLWQTNSRSNPSTLGTSDDSDQLNSPGKSKSKRSSSTGGLEEHKRIVKKRIRFEFLSGLELLTTGSGPLGYTVDGHLFACFYNVPANSLLIQ